MDLIGKQQNGFIKGRSLISNIVKTTEILTYLNQEKKAGIVAVVDFEKCFDRINHNYIGAVFRYFNFGNLFIDCMMLLFTEMELCTTNNGFISDIFKKGRGINQGCPASPLIYSYCGEIMNHLMLQNPHVKGIDMTDLKNILSQFADDTCAFLKFERLCIEEFGLTLMEVETQMGLKVFYEKTTLYRVGSIHKSNAHFYTTNEFTWSDETIETLGIKLNGNGRVNIQCFEDVLTKLHNVSSNWYNRRLTLTGCVLVINTLMSSLFVYKMLTLTNIPTDKIKEAEQLIKNFLWKGKRAKISYDTLIRKKDQGGLRLVDLKTKQKMLKVSWLFKIDNDPFLADRAYCELNDILREKIWHCNISSSDVKLHFDTANNLWAQVLLAWSKINYNETPMNYKEIREQIVWWNSKICIHNKPLFWSKWAAKGIIYVKDLVNEEGECISHNQLQVNWLDLMSIYNAFPQQWKDTLRHYEKLHPECTLTMNSSFTRIVQR